MEVVSMRNLIEVAWIQIQYFYYLLPKIPLLQLGMLDMAIMGTREGSGRIVESDGALTLLQLLMS